MPADVAKRTLPAEMPHGHDYCWSAYSMPLTPPVSPVARLSATPTTPDIADIGRRQPVCGLNGDELSLDDGFALDSLDSPPCSPASFCADVYRLPSDKSAVRSMIIRDCMWWSDETSATRRRPDAPSRDVNKRNNSQQEFALAGFKFESPGSKLASVDPSEIFPSALTEFQAGHFLPSPAVAPAQANDSDDDSDVDVETVDATVQQRIKVDVPSPLSVSCTHEPSPTQSPAAPVSLVIVGGQRLTPDSRFPDASSNLTTDDDDDDDSDGMSTRQFSRASHNILERRRRNELKQKFFNLRDCIPEMPHSDKVAKVTILRKAIFHIRQLKTTESSLLSELAALRKSQGVLRSRLTQYTK